MHEETPNSTTASREKLIGGWRGANCVLTLRQDGSYSLIAGIDNCRDKIVAQGSFQLEQSVLALDTGQDAIEPVRYRVDMPDMDQLRLKAETPDLSGQRSELLNEKDFARISCRERLLFNVRATSIAIRAYLNKLSPVVQPFWWERIKDWWHDPASSHRNPVRIKNLEKVLAHLQMIQHFLADPGHALPAKSCQTLPVLLAQIQSPQDVSFDCAWELADALEGELLHLGDARYIRSVWATWPSARIAKEVWERLTAENLKSNTDQIETVIRPFLLEDQRDLSQEYRRDLAMIRMRQSFLTVMALALLVLDVGFCWLYLRVSTSTEPTSSQAAIQEATVSPESDAVSNVAVTVSVTATTTLTGVQSGGSGSGGSNETSGPTDPIAPTARLFFLIAVAGAIGSVLSRATRLGGQQLPSASEANSGKEEPLGIRTLMSARSIFGAQIVLGATAALFVYLVLASGLLNIVDLKEQMPAVVAVYAFIAGFSEPFLTNVVDRISGKVL
jgi:hypothetical protein